MLELTVENLRQFRERSPTSSLSSSASAESSSTRELGTVKDDLFILVTRLARRGDHEFLCDVDIRVKDDKLVRNNGECFRDDLQEYRQLLDRLNTKYLKDVGSGAAPAIFGPADNQSVNDDTRHITRRKMKRWVSASKSVNQAKPLWQAVRRTKRGFDDKAHETFDSGGNEPQSSTRLDLEPESAGRKRQRRGNYGQVISLAGKLDKSAPPKQPKLNSDQSWKTERSRDNGGHILKDISDDCNNPSLCLLDSGQFGLVRESGRIRSLRLQHLPMK